MKKEEIIKIQEIISSYTYDNTFNQNHIKYYDLTNKIGGHGDYTILLVSIENEVNGRGDKYYLFLDHKASVIIWELDKEMNIINQIG